MLVELVRFELTLACPSSMWLCQLVYSSIEINSRDGWRFRTLTGVPTVNRCVLRVSQLSSTVEYDRLLNRTVRFGKFKIDWQGQRESNSQNIALKGRGLYQFVYTPILKLASLAIFEIAKCPP